MNVNTRTQKAFLNVLTGIGGMILITIIGFISRAIFVRYMGIELLGVNGLFTGVLAFLSLAELGFSTAICQALYKPIADKNEQKIAILMRLFSKIYAVIGAIVLTIGLLMIPFLPYLVNGGVENLSISYAEFIIYYLILLSGILVQYYIAYKRTLLIADQRIYIVNCISTSMTICARIAQIAIIIIWQNYIAYLLLATVVEYLINIIISILVSKKYPYIHNFKNDKLSKQEKKTLYQNTGALFVGKAGSVFTTGIIPVIISVFIGIVAVGLYSNYLLLVSTLTVVTGLLYTSTTAGIGNFVSIETNERKKELFKRIIYLYSFLSIVAVSGLMLLLDKFVAIWLNKDMVLGFFTSLTFALYAFLWITRCPLWSMIEANGLYKHFWYRAIIEIIVFLSLAIPGAILFGIIGVVGAQCIAMIIVQIPIEVYVVCRHALKVNVLFYYRQLLKQIIMAVGIATICFFAIHQITFDGILSFILQVSIIVTIVTVIFILLTFKTKEFNYYTRLVFKRKQKENKQ